MSSRIKSKTVKATLGNKDVLDMFQSVLGTSEGAATLAVAHPKYLELQKVAGRFHALLRALKDSKLLTELFPEEREALSEYEQAIGKQIRESFTAPEMDTAMGTYEGVHPDTVAAFNAVFVKVKQCSVVNTVVVVCNNLAKFKKSIMAVRGGFLLKAGLTWAPLPDLPQLNIKKIYIDDRMTKGDKNFLLMVLKKMYEISHAMYETLMKPDIDVNEFVEVIMSSIDTVKKQIPRCDQAFQKIIESVGLLKGNFNNYYKDFTVSGNPTIIMENFVLDVSKNTKATPAITQQFRKIISHYKKVASQQATNPKLKSLFAQVDANFRELESKVKPDAEDEPSESESEPSDDEKPTCGAGKSKPVRARDAKRALAREAREATGAEPTVGGAEPAVGGAEPEEGGVEPDEGDDEPGGGDDEPSRGDAEPDGGGDEEPTEDDDDGPDEGDDEPDEGNDESGEGDDEPTA